MSFASCLLSLLIKIIQRILLKRIFPDEDEMNAVVPLLNHRQDSAEEGTQTGREKRNQNIFNFKISSKYEGRNKRKKKFHGWRKKKGNERKSEREKERACQGSCP